jgi:hypothetical protein
MVLLVWDHRVLLVNHHARRAQALQQHAQPALLRLSCLIHRVCLHALLVLMREAPFVSRAHRPALLALAQTQHVHHAPATCSFPVRHVLVPALLAPLPLVHAARHAQATAPPALAQLQHVFLAILAPT